MFVTNVSNRMPFQLCEDEQIWTAVTLATNAPWYLVTYRVVEEDEEFVHTKAFVIEANLREFLISLPVGHCKAIGRLTAESFGRWTISQIVKIWETNAEEAEIYGLLIFQQDDGDLVSDVTFGRTPKRKLRKQIFEAPKFF